MIRRALVGALCATVASLACAQDAAPDRAAIERQIARLGAAEAADREAAKIALLRAGEAAVPVLREQAGHVDPRVRAGIQWLLGRLVGTAETRARVAALLETLRTGGASERVVWMTAEPLPERQRAYTELLGLHLVGQRALRAVLAERGGPLETAIEIEGEPGPDRPMTVRVRLTNRGEVGVWLRRPVGTAVRWRSLARHVRLVPPVADPPPVEPVEGEPPLPLTLRHYAYLGPGRTVRLERQVHGGLFGVVEGRVAAGGRLKKIPVDWRRELFLAPYLRPVAEGAQKAILPAAAGYAEGGLAIALTRRPAGDRPGKLGLAFTLRNTGAAPLRVWRLARNLHPLWWLVRAPERRRPLVASGWFASRRHSYQDAPDLTLQRWMLRPLAAGASHVVDLVVPRPAPGRYQLQVGLGPIRSTLPARDVWEGRLVSPALELVVD